MTDRSRHRELPPTFPVALTTWYFAVAADDRFPRVGHRTAETILARYQPSEPTDVPREWRDATGGLTLLGVVLVLQRGRPVYVERCVPSTHALVDMDSRQPRTRQRQEQPRQGQQRRGRPRRELIRPFAVALATMLGGPTSGRGLDAFAAFPAEGTGRVLPDDVRILLHETREVVYANWLAVLLAGGHHHDLWDLRTHSRRAGRTPLRLDDARTWRTT